MVRTDLGMTRGKICSQAAHAVLGLYTELRDEVALAIWGSLDYAQVYLEAGSAEQLYQAQAAAKAKGVTAYTVHDAGRTQIAPMTATVCAIGPVSGSQVLEIVKDPKILQ